MWVQDLELRNKIMKHFLTLLIALSTTVVLAQDTAIKNYSSAPQTFKKDIDKMLTHYLTIKDGFVKEKQKSITKGATKLKNKVLEIKTNELDDEMKKYFEGHKSLILQVCHLFSNKSLSVEAKRKSFEQLSHTMYALIKSFKANRVTIYKQYCPMAFNNTGAYWLSDREIILNPYFADKMLNCGDVIEEILEGN
jgi:Cu(I)/Ag(I) efflux system membrane fusion protein